MNWIMTPDKFLSDKEYQTLLKTLSNAAEFAALKNRIKPIRDYMIIDLALNSGLRVSEIANLQVEDLHITKGNSQIFVRDGKGGKSHLIMIGKDLRRHIKKFLIDQHTKSPYLFISERSPQMTTTAIQKVFKFWAKKAGLPSHHSIHSCRHTYAVRLYKSSGNNLRLVQKQLAHSSISTTQVYADVVDSDVQEAVDKL